MEGEPYVDPTSPDQRPSAKRAERRRGLGDRERVPSRLRRRARSVQAVGPNPLAAGETTKRRITATYRYRCEEEVVL
jgi:hypothetical protein